MRIRLGGGSRILRGGVSVGRGGVRYGGGVGPISVSGGRSRGSRSKGDQGDDAITSDHVLAVLALVALGILIMYFFYLLAALVFLFIWFRINEVSPRLGMFMGPILFAVFLGSIYVFT